MRSRCGCVPVNGRKSVGDRQPRGRHGRNYGVHARQPNKRAGGDAGWRMDPESTGLLRQSVVDDCQLFYHHQRSRARLATRSRFEMRREGWPPGRKRVGISRRADGLAAARRRWTSRGRPFISARRRTGEKQRRPDASRTPIRPPPSSPFARSALELRARPIGGRLLAGARSPHFPSLLPPAPRQRPRATRPEGPRSQFAPIYTPAATPRPRLPDPFANTLFVNYITLRPRRALQRQPFTHLRFNTFA